MKYLKPLGKLIIGVLSFPLLFIIALIDYKVAQRIISNRFTFKDFMPHILTISFGLICYIAYKVDCISLDTNKIDALMPTIINYQGVIFATSLAVTTFILSIFKPDELKTKYPTKEANITDTVDDLRIANMIIFITMIIFLTIWIFMSIDYIHNSVPLCIILFSLLIWSTLAIESIIRGIFLLVKIH